MTTTSRQRNSTFNSDILIPAIWQSVIKLDPRWMWRNPVMFVVEIGAVLTLILTISPTFFGGAAATSGYNFLVTVILILTVVFANYAEAVAEGVIAAGAKACDEASHMSGGEAKQPGGLGLGP